MKSNAEIAVLVDNHLRANRLEEIVEILTEVVIEREKLIYETAVLSLTMEYLIRLLNPHLDSEKQRIEYQKLVNNLKSNPDLVRLRVHDIRLSM